MATWLQIQLKYCAAIGFVFGRLRHKITAFFLRYVALRIDMKELNAVQIRRHHLQPPGR